MERITLFWSQELPAEGDLVGWKLYQSEVSGQKGVMVKEIPFVEPVSEYSASIDIEGSPSGGNKAYFFTITALDRSGNESTPSNEASFTVMDVISPKSPFIIRITG